MRTTTRSAWVSAARFEVEPIDGHAVVAQGAPQVELGRDVQRRGHVVGDEQLGARGERAGQRQPLQLAAGQPGALVADEQAEAGAGGGEVVVELGGGDGVVGVDLVAEADVVGDGAGQDAGQLGDVADLVGAQEHLGLGDRLAVPAQGAGVVHDAGQGAQQ